MYRSSSGQGDFVGVLDCGEVAGFLTLVDSGIPPTISVVDYCIFDGVSLYARGCLGTLLHGYLIELHERSGAR